MELFSFIKSNTPILGIIRLINKLNTACYKSIKYNIMRVKFGRFN